MDLFELLGPIMVGPSSSHTAGAVRIGLAARKLLGARPARAEIALHGSFAATGRGHGTDRALVAGLLGFAPDDDRIPESFSFAEREGLHFRIQTVQLRDAHPNSARIRLRDAEGDASLELIGASVGGGRIEIRELDGIGLCFSADAPSLIIKNRDYPGCVAEVSLRLAQRGINIATFQVNRSTRGGLALMVIECDAPVRQELVEEVRTLPDILRVIGFNPYRGDDGDV